MKFKKTEQRFLVKHGHQLRTGIQLMTIWLVNFSRYHLCVSFSHFSYRIWTQLMTQLQAFHSFRRSLTFSDVVHLHYRTNNLNYRLFIWLWKCTWNRRLNMPESLLRIIIISMSFAPGFAGKLTSKSPWTISRIAFNWFIGIVLFQNLK